MINKNIKKYIKLLRLDHYIKQIFILPGFASAIFLTKSYINSDLIFKLLIGFVATCFIASANYVINEYLDAKFDKFHPTKKYRVSVTENINGKIVFVIWIFLTMFGILLGMCINKLFVFTQILLWFMGILYNVKPIRLKDIAIIDVLSESVNNAIRLLLGWFIVTNSALPPCSLLLGYWMTGAFLMATKRFSEYRMINDAEIASNYRKSFKFYTEKSLCISSFFYAICAIFFIGIFLIKYRIELILFVVALIGLFCYYFYMALENNTAVQKPEKLLHERKLMIYLALLIVFFTVLMFVDIPILKIFNTNEIIKF